MLALIIAWRRTCSYGPIWASQPSSSTVSLHPLTDCVGKCSSAPHVLPTGHLQRMCAGYCTKGVELTAATPARPAEHIHAKGQPQASGTHPLEKVNHKPCTPSGSVEKVNHKPAERIDWKLDDWQLTALMGSLVPLTFAVSTICSEAGVSCRRPPTLFVARNECSD